MGTRYAVVRGQRLMVEVISHDDFASRHTKLRAFGFDSMTGKRVYRELGKVGLLMTEVTR